MTEKEFTIIVHETKGVVLNAIGKYLNVDNYAYIDDVSQEVYIRLYRSLTENKFQKKSKLTTYLYVIAKNESLRMNEKLLREKKKTEGLLSGIARELRSQTDYASNLHISENTDYSDAKQQIESNHLPRKYQDVLKLLTDGMSYKEIAETLGIKAGTVKSRVHRGKEILQKLNFNANKQGNGYEKAE